MIGRFLRRNCGKCGLTRDGFSPRSLTLLFAFVAALPAYSQVFSFGVKAGTPLTFVYAGGAVPSGGLITSENRFTIGPTAEFHFPLGLSLGVDALWRHSGFTAYSGLFSEISSVNDWQVPLFAKYEIQRRTIRPFVDGGVVYRHVSVSSSSSVPPTNRNTAGVSAGGGVTLKLLRLRLSPEIRYTHWPTPPFAAELVENTTNQVDLLVGITF
jgi:hypothetical protein